MSILTALVAVPTGTDFDSLPESVQDAFKELFIRHQYEPSNIVDGRDLRLTNLRTPPMDEGQTVIDALNSMINAFGLDWVIVHCQDRDSHMEVGEDPIEGEEAPVSVVTVHHTSDMSAYRLTLYRHDNDGNPIPGSEYLRPFTRYAGYADWQIP